MYSTMEDSTRRRRADAVVRTADDRDDDDGDDDDGDDDDDAPPSSYPTSSSTRRSSRRRRRHLHETSAPIGPPAPTAPGGGHRRSSRRSHRRRRLLLLRLLAFFSSAPIRAIVADVHAHAGGGIIGEGAGGGGGYMIVPPSRNYLAYLSNTVLPSSSRPLSSLPGIERRPDRLVGGSTCGRTTGATAIVEEGEEGTMTRDYDAPLSRMGNAMPLDVRAAYAAGSEVRLSVLLDMPADDGGRSGGLPLLGGHMEFHLCPVTYPHPPTEDCFRRHPLEFVKDEYYGANRDERRPGRAYVPYASAFDDGRLVAATIANATASEREGGASTLRSSSSMAEFAYVFRLPRHDALETHPASLVGSGVPNGDVLPNGDVRVATTTLTMAQQFVHGTTGGRGGDVGDDGGGDRARRRRREEEGSEGGGADGMVMEEGEVLIASVVTDGNGTTIITTLHGGTTIIPGGPKIPATSTSTYGSREIYGDGLPGGGGGQDLDIFWAVPDLDPGAPPTASVGGGGGGGDVVVVVAPQTSAAAVPDDDDGVHDLATNRPVVVAATAEEADAAVPASSSAAAAAVVVGAAPNARYVLLRWHYVPARVDCPDAWGGWTGPPAGGVCDDGDDGDNGDDDFGAPPHEEYWNCAEILILGDGSDGDGGDGDDDDDDAPGPSVAAPTPPRPAEPYRQKATPSSADDEGAAPTPPRPAEPYRPKATPSPADEVVDAPISTEEEDAVEDEGRIAAWDDVVSTGNDRPIAIDVVANDECTGSLLPVVKRTTSARHGTCDVVNNQVVYTPKDGYEGWDHCSYRVCLSAGVCDEALVEIRVWPASILPPDQLESNPAIPKKATPPPAGETESATTPLSDEGRITAVDDGATTGLNRPIMIDVVANDEHIGSLSPVVKRSTMANHGTCEVVNNQVLYTPNDGHKGWDHCSYRVCLSAGVCDEALITIEVSGPAQLEPNPGKPTHDEAPADEEATDIEVFATNDEATTAGDTPITIDVTANDYASGGKLGKSLAVTHVSIAMHGLCEIVGNNVKYTPPPVDGSFEGWDQCVYTVCSDAARLGKILDRIKEEVGCERGRIEIQVLPVSIEEAVDEPMPMVPTLNNGDGELVSVYAEDEVVVTLQNTPITVDVASNDFSKGAETLKVTQTGGAEHGTCVLTSDNQVQYIPDEEFLGTDHCGYITCTNFVCDEGILAIKVTSLKTENMPMPHQSSSGFVSNYESSGGLSLMSTKERPISEANYKEKYDGGRNLRGSGRGRLAYGNIGQ